MYDVATRGCSFLYDDHHILTIIMSWRRIEQISRAVFKVNPGSLLTALQRLERQGWLDAEWQRTENSRRAKIYRLTRAGRKQLEAETTDWTRRAQAIARLLKAEA